MEKDLQALEQEIDNYKGRSESKVEVDSDKPTNLVMSAPVHVHEGVFFDPANLPSKLPPISQKKYEFAVEFAYTNKSLSSLAERYNVAYNTILTWLRDERVKTYVASFRFDARMHYLANWMSLEREAVDAVHRILQMRLSSSTVSVIGQTARYVLDYMSRVRGGPSVGSGQDSESGTYTGGNNPIEDKRQENPEDLKRRIQELDAELENLSVWEENLFNE